MLFAVDIDGTIGYRNLPVFLKVTNDRLNLGIPEERLKSLTYDDFMTQPECIAYRQHVGESYFEHSIGWMDFDPEVLAALLPFPHAVEAVTRLVSIAPVAYYTARYSPSSAERSQTMALATEQWLARQGFPHPYNVIYCASVCDKLAKIVQLIDATPQPIVLIDDNSTKLLNALEGFDGADTLRRHLTIVAFKATRLPQECHGMRVYTLKSWQDDVSTLLDQLKKEGRETLLETECRY